MATPMTRPARSTAAIVGMVLGGLGIAFVALIGVSVLAVTFLGTSSEGRFEAVDMDPNTPGVQNGGGVGTSPSDPTDDPQPGSGPLAADPVADPDVFCPTGDEVSAATGSVIDPDEVHHYTPEVQVNGVAMSTVGCEYGAMGWVLAVTGPEAATVLEDLRSSSGYPVTDGGRDVPSLDVAVAGADGGSRLTVVQVGDVVYAVSHVGQDQAPVDALVDLVRTRVG